MVNQSSKVEEFVGSLTGDQLEELFTMIQESFTENEIHQSLAKGFGDHTLWEAYNTAVDISNADDAEEEEDGE